MTEKWLQNVPLKNEDTVAYMNLIGESYLTERFHQIFCYLAEQFCQITCCLSEQFSQIADYLTEQFQQIAHYFVEHLFYVQHESTKYMIPNHPQVPENQESRKQNQ